MVKQETQVCVCNKPMEFPEGQVKAVCSCGKIWELDNWGVWFSQTELVPLRAKENKVMTRAEKYANYHNSRRKGRELNGC